MLVVGVAGGIASGKSLVAEHFRQLGAAVLDADGMGHKVLQEAEVTEKLVERFGDGILNPATRQIDRNKLARIVFAPGPDGPPSLTYLEEITHPRIKERLQEEISRLARNGTPVSILDAAVMFKSGWDSVCDHIVFVDAPEPQRIARAAARGWTVEQFRSRESSQSSLDVKRQKADIVISNSGTVDHLFRQVEEVWKQLTPR